MLGKWPKSQCILGTEAKGQGTGQLPHAVFLLHPSVPHTPSTVFDFELPEEDMNALFSLDRNLRLTKFPTAKNHKDYPFHIEY
ncbi:1,5-anhydro-D-fructose reductase [Myotis brandtii]|uniref:1,5-anhydro-D-fructose reductase n=1 Tax=Myotis brandtii TaxID=109478 RepID=S7MYS1_MYOBR|nr:1,5-anhydro-D-fructose reductase [Myotis brandtii]